MKSVIFAGIVGLTVLLAPAIDAYGQSGEVAKVAITSSVESDVLKVGSEQTVSWTSKNFPKGAFVNINLLRKVSDSPAEYELVRHISRFTVNDGSEEWRVEKSDIGGNLSIEVTCAGATRFANGCISTLDNKEFAVKQGFLHSVANVFLSIFGLGE